MEQYACCDGPKSKKDILGEIHTYFKGEANRYGSVASPTTEGFLALALLGKDAWNAWRHAYPFPHPNFEGVDFRATKIDFSDFVLASPSNKLSYVNFDGAKLPDRISFRGARLGYSASFINTSFGDFADFSHAIFADCARFIGAEFGNSSKFRHCVFGNSCSFHGAEFGESTDFFDAHFGNSAEFCESEFKDDAQFSRCKFADAASFIDAHFGDIVRFNDAVFGDSADFTDCTFGDSVNFSGAIFGNLSKFTRAKFGTFCRFDRITFGNDTDFSSSIFTGETRFEDATFGPWISFDGAEFSGKTLFLKTKFSGDASFAGDTRESKDSPKRKFQEISFAGSNFFGDADFTGRKFSSKTDFGVYSLDSGLQSAAKNNNPEPQKTRFHGIAEFHECEFHQNTSFGNADFFAHQTPRAARAYRTLKGSMAKLNSTSEEQQFFRLEIHAEYPNHSIGRKLLYRIYSATSFYGVSIVRPALALCFFSLLIGIMHGILVNLCAGDYFPKDFSEIDANRTFVFLRYVLIDALPLPGFEKTQIELRERLFYDSEWIITAAVFLEIVHKFISLGCYFLLGLALRNLFKMKS